MRDSVAIPTSTLIFSTMPDSDMTLSTLSDVSRLPKFKMSAQTPEIVDAIVNSGNWRTLDNVGTVTDESGAVTNVGVAVAIESQTHSVQ